MKVYIVFDNADFGSTFSPDPDEIDSVWLNKAKAVRRCQGLNKGKQKWMTKARVLEMEAKP